MHEEMRFSPPPALASAEQVDRECGNVIRILALVLKRMVESDRFDRVRSIDLRPVGKIDVVYRSKLDSQREFRRVVLRHAASAGSGDDVDRVELRGPDGDAFVTADDESEATLHKIDEILGFSHKRQRV